MFYKFTAFLILDLQIIKKDVLKSPNEYIAFINFFLWFFDFDYIF